MHWVFATNLKVRLPINTKIEEVIFYFLIIWSNLCSLYNKIRVNLWDTFLIKNAQIHLARFQLIYVFAFFCIDQITDLCLGENYGKIMKIKLKVSVLRWNLNNLSRGLNPPNPGLNSAPAWNIWYNFKWNQPYLNRGLNLNRRSNSLNSATETLSLEKLNS